MVCSRWERVRTLSSIDSLNLDSATKRIEGISGKIRVELSKSATYRDEEGLVLVNLYVAVYADVIILTGHTIIIHHNGIGRCRERAQLAKLIGERCDGERAGECLHASNDICIQPMARQYLGVSCTVYSWLRFVSTARDPLPRIIYNNNQIIHIADSRTRRENAHT